VVDDHDMGITHIIRGDDHLTNAARQAQIYRAMGWQTPEFAHIPLIHGPDGAKLSKRHGALGAEAYRDMGYLPEAMRNYLLRLGWGHGDAEVISTAQAIEWFDQNGVGKSAARSDFVKLESLNGHYMREAPSDRLAEEVVPRLEKQLGRRLDAEAKRRVAAGMDGLKARAKNLVELTENTVFYVVERPLEMNDKAAKILGTEARVRLAGLHRDLSALSAWNEADIEAAVRAFAEAAGCKLGDAAQPLRAALSGSNTSPGIFEVMAVLGREESLARIADQAT
jgi:glutamyl-tRNA synthetase